MAPWQDRADSYRPRRGFVPPPPPPPPAPGTSPTGPTPVRSRSNAAASRYASQTTRMSPFEVLDGSELHVSSSSEDEDPKPTKPLRPRHGRSLSHPFPSLFANKKKKPARTSSEDSGSDSTDDLAQMTNSKSKAQQPHHTQRNGRSSESRDFATGHCMTCGSLVRWPRELHVFRCTICLTVNDLQPLFQDERREDTPRDRSPADDTSTPPQQLRRNSRTSTPTPAVARRINNHSAAEPVSIEHTRTLITQCLQEYLQRALAASVPGHSTWGPESGTKPYSPDGTSTGSASPDAPVLFSPQEPAQIPIRSAKRDSELKLNKPFRQTGSSHRSYSTSYPDKRPTLRDARSEKMAPNAIDDESGTGQDTKRLFRPLDDYLISTVTSFQALNSSFVADRSSLHPEPTGDPVRRRTSEVRREPVNGEYPFTDLDAKMLMVGDFAENGSWWTGGQEEHLPTRTASHKSTRGPSYVSQRSPRLDWEELDEWYSMVLSPAKLWPAVYDGLVRHDPSLAATDSQLRDLESTILRAQDHTQRNLLKATESLLKRPGRPIARPSDLRFLLILLANPLLCTSRKSPTDKETDSGPGLERVREKVQLASGPASGQHSGIIKRILGLLSNAPNDCHGHVISWFARYPETRFAEVKDLVGGFLVYRLLRQHDKKQEVKVDVVEGLIPSMSAGRTAASLHAAIGPNSRQSKKSKEPPKKQVYSDDWQIRAAAQVMALVFAANNTTHSRRKSLPNQFPAQDGSYPSTSRNTVHTRGQVFPTSDFYVTLLDDSDLVADFEAWEHKRGKFSFCQYPFLLGIGAKIQILEYDAHRQMQSKARDAFFDSLLSRRAIEQYLTLDVRRDCLVEDSLSAVSEVIGSGSEDVKKGLRIIFRGEEGIDAGGLRKEWFLLLIREVFNPEHGMFVYDEDSQHCYFNPNSFETSDQYFLVGVVFGLAIYNSTILDVAFPPFAFRKLLMAAPATAATSPRQQPRPTMTYTLDDLAQYRPRLARGLRQLLDYEGDNVEGVFCLDFVAVVEKYGAVEQVPLCPGGERRPVTKSNRREYVDLYVRYLLDTAVTRQFEPFKRGFFTVCGGNALSLFRPEEIELLVRGSDDALDIDSLRAVAVYDNWGSKDAAKSEATIHWFWETFATAPPQDQRKLLLFITGSDRIPAMGAASLQIRVACLGEDTGRYPTARTCFNSLSLYRCRDRGRLERLLWTAVRESEGFGLT